MTALEDLWYGNVAPHRWSIKKGSHAERALSMIAKHDDTLRSILSDEQKEEYIKLYDCQSELTDILERDAFAEGFSLAVKIMIDVIKTMDIPSIDD